MDLSKSIRNSFSDSYEEARNRFLNAAEAKKIDIQSYINPNIGSLKEQLSCDTAWMGPPNAKQVLVIISGTHGVEGFCGSGCQIDWMSRTNVEDLPTGVALLFIHAINPFGFSWCRRVTEEGCDLNRNYLDFSKPLPLNEGHDELADYFVPSSLDTQTMEKAEIDIKLYRETHGE